MGEVCFAPLVAKAYGGHWTKVSRRGVFALLALLFALPSPSHTAEPRADSAAPLKAGGGAPFSFTIAGDMRDATGTGEFPAVLAAIGDSGGPGAFLVVPGDIDPAEKTTRAIAHAFGEEFPWYPVVGNHDVESRRDLAWIKNRFPALPGVARRGPRPCSDTTYSFDRGDAHFVVLNVYCDSAGEARTDGDISPELYRWLAADLGDNHRPWVFVFGHEPAFPQPDATWGTQRHVGNSLDKYPTRRDAFWELLASRRVTAYVHGHAHQYARFLRNGVWQIDAGIAQGAGTHDTFLRVTVEAGRVTFASWRSLGEGLFRKVDEWQAARPATP
jgi:hypothetical protein